MIRKYVWFDAWIRTKKGKCVPFYDFTTMEREIKDQELVWFHEGYGYMRLYRLHKVDDENYIAELINNCGCYTCSEEWDSWLKNPQLAIDASCKK